MFDIGFWEMLVIGVMALLILGPERLPGAIKSTMSTVRSIKQMATGFKDEVASQIDAHELHQNLKKAEALGMKSIGKDLQESVTELKAAADSVKRPYKLDSNVKDSSSVTHQDDEDTEQSDNAKHIDANKALPQQTEQISLLPVDEESDAKTTEQEKPSSGKA